MQVTDYNTTQRGERDAVIAQHGLSATSEMRAAVDDAFSAGWQAKNADQQDQDKALRRIAHEAADMANGEAVDAYTMLAAAVEAFLRGAPADEIIAEAHAH